MAQMWERGAHRARRGLPTRERREQHKEIQTNLRVKWRGAGCVLEGALHLESPLHSCVIVPLVFTDS